MGSISRFNFITLLGGVAIVSVLLSILLPTLFHVQREIRLVSSSMMLNAYEAESIIRTTPTPSYPAPSTPCFCEACGRWLIGITQPEPLAIPSETIWSRPLCLQMPLSRQCPPAQEKHLCALCRLVNQLRMPESHPENSPEVLQNLTSMPD